MSERRKPTPPELKRQEQALRKDSERKFTNSLILDFFDEFMRYPRFKNLFLREFPYSLHEPNVLTMYTTQHVQNDERFTFKYIVKDDSHRYLSVAKDIQLTKEFSLENELLILSTMHDETLPNDPGYTIYYSNKPQAKDEIEVTAENTSFAINCAEEVLFNLGQIEYQK